MTQEIKLPPLPTGWDEQSTIAYVLRDYARAAVALNAPAWHITKNDPPPDTREEVVIFDPRDGDKYILEARLVRSDPVGSPRWTSLPPLLPLLAGREES